MSSYLSVIDRGVSAPWFTTERTAYVRSGVVAERTYRGDDGAEHTGVFAEVFRRPRHNGFDGLPSTCWVRVEDLGEVQMGRPAVFQAILDRPGGPWATTITTSEVVDVFT